MNPLDQPKAPKCYHLLKSAKTRTALVLASFFYNTKPGRLLPPIFKARFKPSLSTDLLKCRPTTPSNCQPFYWFIHLQVDKNRTTKLSTTG